MLGLHVSCCFGHVYMLGLHVSCCFSHVYMLGLHVSLLFQSCIHVRATCFCCCFGHVCIHVRATCFVVVSVMYTC